MKQLLLGNFAVARGIYEAGCEVVSSYPGTPSTEITECLSEYPKSDIYCEWAPNEKVALETAIGASIAGKRAFCAMKHVGINVAADPLFTASYTGVRGGLVIAVADDPGAHSSQNEQDSRNYALAAKLPMLEPSDSAECLEFVKAAFELSEKYDTPVLLRLQTRVSHSRSLVEIGERIVPEKKPYAKDSAKYVMIPVNATKKHAVVEERMYNLDVDFFNSSLNQTIYNDRKIGIITSGTAYLYAREVFGDSVSYLKLGTVNPLPTDLLFDFGKTIHNAGGTVYVIEELDPFIENKCRSIGAFDVVGKTDVYYTEKLFTPLYEYSQSYLREKIQNDTETNAVSYKIDNIPPRPPVLCAGCPHRGVFHILAKHKLFVSGDIGCYTLGAGAPLNAIDTTVCMGASISGLHGFLKADPTYAGKAVSVIGDSTFIHSGITGLINSVYNKSACVHIVLDNSITGMTGHQNNPANGKDIYGDPASAVDLERLCASVGVEKVSVCDPYDLGSVEDTVTAHLKYATETGLPSVIIARRPCALIKGIKHNAPLTITDCKGCKGCLKIGCPAISMKDKRAVIDETSCVGCGICKGLCNFGCIK
ncbi:MAG: indolepyruvate ferredoxin oxidoreductase subunit alpha [Oscillospiraceae bacterium]|nr:indolepyruvate ferredoxin oxidoreductase subunit alpha [Oscillospiraceae bacterium]